MKIRAAWGGCRRSKQHFARSVLKLDFQIDLEDRVVRPSDEAEIGGEVNLQPSGIDVRAGRGQIDDLRGGGTLATRAAVEEPLSVGQRNEVSARTQEIAAVISCDG